jgi:crotonobetaine/carnitine-CoA ligase
MPATPFATSYEAVRATARAHPGNAFLCVPAKADRDYLPTGYEVSYGAAQEHIEALRETYAAAGYGLGHRAAIMLDNRPEYFFHLLALNALGVGAVPVNPEYTHDELFYLLDHSEADLAIVLGKHRGRMEKVAGERKKPLPIVTAELDGKGVPRLEPVPRATTPARPGSPERTSEASLMYTSGTTGRPKGCIHDNHYWLNAGEWYAGFGGCMSLEHGRDRLINPLPLFHANAGVISFMGMVLTANCNVIPERFSPSGWWKDVVSTRSTLMHYLGIMPPILMKQAPTPEERAHALRWGLGAGIDPAIHRPFEERFRMPILEVWGMTETGRLLGDVFEPRRIDTRAFGKPVRELEARVVDDKDRELPPGEPGELLVRSSGPDPRRGFFRGYLKDEKATEEVWRGGWFHTGDVVTQGPDGMLYFVERRKNIIRRSGENISAAEVENGILEHAAIAKVTALSVEDELREEEVMACIVLAPGHAPTRETAEAIAAFGRERLAYYKVPGWLVFVDDLPTTSTQKVQKGLIFPKGQDPRSHPRAFDLRALKTRAKSGA